MTIIAGGESIKSPKFIVDNNVGKLAKWLRMMGYDTLFFRGHDDSDMVATALAQNRVLITRDTHIRERRVASTGELKLVFLDSDEPEVQIRQVVQALKLDTKGSFSLCLECNEALVERTKEGAKERIPPYVFRTQSQYMECPACHRIYWRGTHWQRMSKKLDEFVKH
ncbi:MAG: Mut7-C RNAse domain-containing protein [Chloroflexi bacterium]|nr:Mut7-C RNAse domain-containing protein [Chloroflexota bacterium]